MAKLCHKMLRSKGSIPLVHSSFQTPILRPRRSQKWDTPDQNSTMWRFIWLWLREQ
jgi:hypothetical protein